MAALKGFVVIHLRRLFHDRFRSAPLRRMLFIGIITCIMLAGCDDLFSAVLTGVVMEEVGTPVDAAQVVLLNQADGTEVRRTTTDNSGAFTFAKLTAGEYGIKIEAHGFFPRTKHNIHIGDQSNVDLREITLSMFMSQCGLAPLIEAEYSVIETKEKRVDIRGAILDFSGGVDVDLYFSGTGEEQLSIKTGKTGTFRFSVVGPGVFTLHFSKEGYLERRTLPFTVKPGDQVSVPPIRLNEYPPVGDSPIQICQ